MTTTKQVETTSTNGFCYVPSSDELLPEVQEQDEVFNNNFPTKEDWDEFCQQRMEENLPYLLAGTSTKEATEKGSSLSFRKLRKDEIECRVQSSGGGKAKLLLYKDARVDMNILDESVGNDNWQRDHFELKGNLYCKVGIKQPNGEWVWKSDCGSESNTERQKGEASDAFKRACFNWGIGRELYTGPAISVSLNDKDMFNGKLCQTFSVADINIDDNRRITYLTITDKWGKERFRYGKPELSPSQRTSAIRRLAKGEDIWGPLEERFNINKAELQRDVELMKKGSNLN